MGYKAENIFLEQSEYNREGKGALLVTNYQIAWLPDPQSTEQLAPVRLIFPPIYVYERHSYCHLAQVFVSIASIITADKIGGKMDRTEKYRLDIGVYDGRQVRFSFEHNRPSRKEVMKVLHVIASAMIDGPLADDIRGSAYYMLLMRSPRHSSVGNTSCHRSTASMVGSFTIPSWSGRAKASLPTTLSGVTHPPTLCVLSGVSHAESFIHFPFAVRHMSSAIRIPRFSSFRGLHPRR